MAKTKYLTASEVQKKAKHHIASMGSCFAPIKKIYGTLTTNQYGQRYNTQEVSIMILTENFWDYWNGIAKQENVFIELYADKPIQVSPAARKGAGRKGGIGK